MKRVRRWLAVMLAAIMALGCVGTVFAAPNQSDEIAIQIGVRYEQTEARKMLGMINEFRTGDNAWYWDRDDETKIWLNDLDEYQYDYTLEKYAMQRAAEIALNFDHMRPDGTMCYSISGRIRAENIAAGNRTAEATFTQWQEENEDYAGQGHRRTMLSRSYTAVGIACVYYKGYYYWVQEFGYAVDTEETASNDSETTVSIDVSKDLIESLEVSQPSAIEMEVGNSIEPPAINADIRLKNVWPGRNNPITVCPEWTSGNSNIADFTDDGKLEAKSVGSTSITADVVGQTVTVPVTVTGVSLAGASVTLPQDRFSYNGKPIEPEPTVTLNGKILNAGTDYTVSYENNTNEGDATVIITGTGSYSGSVRKTFTITSCNHKWDEGVITTPAGCETEGVRTYTCKNCGNTRTESIPALDHDWDGGKITQEPTCTKEGVKTFTCSRCGDSYTEPVAALGHKFGDWETVTSPTCTNQGSKKRTCERCRYTETQNISATGHTWESDYTVDQEPTCTEDGSQSIHCSKCDAVKDTQVIPAPGHDWKEGVITAEPTCTKAGVKTFTCDRCGDTRTEMIPALGHSYGAWVETKPATCTEEGEKTCTCTRCGDTKKEPIALLPHSWDDGVVTTEPTCKAEGVKTYTCMVCGTTQTEPVDRVPHTIAIDAAVEPTCEGTGLTEGSHCSVCGEILTVQEIIPAKGHNWDEGTITKEPTCTEDGGKTITCTVCGATRTEVIEAAGHSFGAWETITSPTCTDQGSQKRTCEKCGYTETQNINATGHTWESEFTIDKEPTCTVEGSKSIHCSKCDAVKDAQVIPALGHSWDEGKVTKEATCTETGQKIYTCTVCKDTYVETIPLAAHTLQWVTDKAATETEEGSRHEECSVCGWIGKTETIPALGSEPVVTPNPDQNKPGNGEVAGNTPTDTNMSGNTNEGNGTAATAENTDQISSPDTGDHSLEYALTVMLAAGATILVLTRKKKNV